MWKKIAAFIVVLALLWGCAGTPEAQKREVNVTCPVSGTALGSQQTAHAVEYKGETYYFCCGSCKKEFERNPEEYLGE